MRYLFSVIPEKIAETDKDKWAEAGKPVIPWFPAPVENVFVSIGEAKKAPYALVENRKDLDLDNLLETLKKYYPDLPAKLLENYILATSTAAYRFPVGTKLQIIIDENTAKIFPIGKAEEAYTLWEKQPFGELGEA